MSLHPSVAAVRHAVRRGLADLDPGARLVVACSGGADSLALASATVFEGREQGWYVVGATVDHGLQEGSDTRADAVVAQLATIGVDETVAARATVEAPGLGPEAAARAARYAVLEQLRESFDADLVLLGHTRDDQAETVLLGLTRGSGGRALAGMRRSFDHYRRPLLDVSHTDTVTACQVEGLRVWEDPHNVDPAFTRVRVRRRVLPLLEDELGPGVTDALARTADQLRPDMELLDAYAEQALLDVGGPRRGPLRSTPSRRCRARSGPGCSGWPRSRPAPRRARSSTSTCWPSTPWSPTGTARSGSTCPATCAPYAGTVLLVFERA